MNFHHAAGIVFVCWPFVTKHYASEMIYSIIQGEITSPLVNLSDFLENIEKPKAAIALTLKKVFMAVFIFFRVFMCFPTMLKIQFSNADQFFKLMPTGLWVLSMKWVWMMLNKSSKLAHQVEIHSIFSNAFRLIQQTLAPKNSMTSWSL